jgi:intracellular septation protein
MKLLFDLFPVILFFATFKYSEKNPEAAAGWMNALLGGAVDLKQAPILLATVRFRPAAQLLGVVPRIALTHPTCIQRS